MKTPILIYEPRDLEIFDTVEAAELHCEEWILEEENQYFYDSEGRRLTVGPGIERPVHISCDPTEQPHPEELSEVITEYLLAIGKTAKELHGLSLSELLKIAYPHAHCK